MNAEMEDRRNERRSSLRREALLGTDLLSSEVRRTRSCTKDLHCRAPKPIHARHTKRRRSFDFESLKDTLKNITSQKTCQQIRRFPEKQKGGGRRRRKKTEIRKPREIFYVLGHVLFSYVAVVFLLNLHLLFSTG